MSPRGHCVCQSIGQTTKEINPRNLFNFFVSAGRVWEVRAPTSSKAERTRTLIEGRQGAGARRVWALGSNARHRKRGSSWGKGSRPSRHPRRSTSSLRIFSVTPPVSFSPHRRNVCPVGTLLAPQWVSLPATEATLVAVTWCFHYSS